MFLVFFCNFFFIFKTNSVTKISASTKVDTYNKRLTDERGAYREKIQQFSTAVFLYTV